MTKINFIKMNAAGNDFIIIDARQNNYQFNARQISKMSDRKNIGCDQFILLKNSQKADIFMDIYNSDGSSSAACGNATRCVASMIMSQINKSSVFIQTAASILKCSYEGDLVSVNMGQPIFDWQKIPLSKELNIDSFKVDDCQYQFSAVNMGNPHIVTFLKGEIADDEFFKISPLIENSQLFPQKTNIEFAQIINENHIKVRVWERGAGETLACGSGACAVGVLAIKKSLVKNQRIRVSFKGGDIFIQLDKDGSVLMIGNYQEIFQGVINEDFIN